MGRATVGQVLRKAFSENLTVMTGTPQQLRCVKCEERRFVRWLLESESGATVNIFSESEKYDAILVVPRSVLNALGTAYRTAQPHGDEASQDSHETDHGVLASLEGNLGRLFSLELDSELGDWTNQAHFSLPSDYGYASMPEIIWRSSDYAHYRVSSQYGDFFMLVLTPLDFTLGNRLASSQRFRERAAEEIIHTYIGGDAEVRGEPDSAEIRIVDEPAFRLGEFVLARHYVLGEDNAAVRLEALAVGPPVPESGIAAQWTVRLGEITHGFGLAFPDLDARPAHIKLAKLIARQTMRHLRATLEPLAPVVMSRARIRPELESDRELFLIKASVSIMDRRLSIWAYAPLAYVAQLHELLHGAVLWDIRKRSTFSMMLCLISFHQETLRSLLADNPRMLLPESGEQSEDEADTGFLLGHLLGLAPRRDRVAIAQFFLIGQLGYRPGQIRSLFYYYLRVDEAPTVVRMLSGFDDALITEVMPRMAADEFRRSRHASYSLDILIENNEQLLAALYEAIAKGKIDASARTRMLLQDQFLQPYNERYREKIEALLSADNTILLIRSLRVEQAQNAFYAMQTRTLAQALLLDSGAGAMVARLVARTYWRDIEYAQETVRDDLKAGRLTLRTVYDAMLELERELRRAKDQRLLVG